MTQETFNAVLVFIGALFGLLVLFADRNNKRTNDIVRGLLDVAQALAKATPTETDDAVVRQMRAAFGIVDEPVPPVLPAEPVTVLPPVDPAAVG